MCTIAANGTGTATMVPSHAHESWDVTNTAVSTSTATNIPLAQVYVGAAIPGTAKMSTYTGNQDDSDTEFTVPSGSYITATWTNADPGATAYINVTGNRITRR